MSAHSIKSKRRHPEPTTFKRERFKLGHMTFELIDHPKDGVTFCMLAGPPRALYEDKPICSGHMKSAFSNELSMILERVLEIKEQGKLEDET